MKFILAAFIFAFSYMVHSAEQMSFQQELAIERLITAVETNNYNEISKQIGILEESGLKIKGDLLYYKALGLFGTGEDSWASFYANRYLVEHGREAKFYRDALELKGQAADNVDRNILANSRIYYTRENLELASEPRLNSTGAYKRLQELTALELSIADNIYKNNGDGTISVYSVIKRTEAESYDLIRVDWMACPVGTSYTPEADQPCSGTATKYTHAQMSSFWKTFSYAGHSDWRIPSAGIIGTDTISTVSGMGDLPGTSFHRDYMEASGLLSIKVSPQAFLLNRRGGIVRDKDSGQFVNKPAYAWDSSVYPVYATQSYYCFPLLTLFRHNTDSASCYYPKDAPSFELVLMRGPFLVKSNLSGKCHARSWNDGLEIYNMRILPNQTPCELDSEPGQIFRLVDAQRYLEGVQLKTE